MKICKECKMEYSWLKEDVCSQCRNNNKKTNDVKHESKDDNNVKEVSE